MRPTVDTEANHPGFPDRSFRSRFGIEANAPIILLVSRIATHVKLEGILRTVDAVAELPVGYGARLVIVGDGDARAAVERRAEQSNDRLGERRVIVAGAMVDPRPAYAAADVVVGMQGSAMRGLAFAKPTIIIGAGGFSRIVDETSFPWFMEHGFSGVASGSLAGLLTDQLTALLGDRSLRKELGQFGRSAACNDLSLAASAELLESIYVSDGQRSPSARERLDAAALLVGSIVRSKLGRRRSIRDAVRVR
jgi:glycosyltransferase involved in cell wall biosynthesis